MLGPPRNLIMARFPGEMPCQLVGRFVPPPIAPWATPRSRAQSPVATNVVVSASSGPDDR